jgi:DNA-binding beta-propeller fold protein YncE
MSMLHVRRSLIVAALFAITGCSSSISPSSMPIQTKSLHSNALATGSSFVHAGVPFMPRETRLPGLPEIAHYYPTLKPLLFEGDSQNGQVEIFKQSGIATNSAPIAKITDGILCPYGMVVDKIGRLYVANNCGRSTVTEYPRGKTIHSKTISAGISNPLGLAMDKHGTLFVSNYPAAITEYPYGSTSPSTTITGSGMIDPFGLAVDGNGNLFVADFGANQVFEIAAGTTTVTPLNLQDLTEPLGVAIDKTTGNLWVTDGSGDKVNVYAPGSTTPSHTITANYTFPYAITISSAGRAAVSNIDPPVAVYAYKPGQFSSYATLTNDIAQPTGLLFATP